MRAATAIFISFLLLFSASVFAQSADSAKASAILKPVLTKDSTVKEVVVVKKSGKKQIIIDTSIKFDPHIATVRSAIIPGWGQAYNKQYWKIPIIYGALGTTAVIFFYNLSEYRLLRRAYSIRLSGDTQSFSQVDPSLQNLSTDAIGSYRTEFRQNIDYSALVFLLFWGLNVVDATVSAQLKSFNVSDDLTLDIHPRFDPLFKTTGLSFVLNIGKNKSKSVTSLTQTSF